MPLSRADRQEGNADIKGFTDLKGKKSAQSLTSNFGKIAEQNGAELVGTDGFDQSIQLVLTGRADATINDSLSFLDFKKHKPDAPVTVVAEQKDADYSGVIIRKGELNCSRRSTRLWRTSRPTEPTRRFPTPISARTCRSNSVRHGKRTQRIQEAPGDPAGAVSRG